MELLEEIEKEENQPLRKLEGKGRVIEEPSVPLEKCNIEIVLFSIEELQKSLEKLKRKCLEPFIDNNLDLEENRDLFTSFLFIKESFKTLNKLQNLIKEI